MQDHEDATMNVDTDLGNNASSSAGPDNLSLAALNNALETLKVGIFSKIDSMAVDLKYLPFGWRLKKMLPPYEPRPPTTVNV